MLRQINDLRIENRSLKEKVNQYNKEHFEFEINKSDLASGQDLYIIDYSYYDWNILKTINDKVTLCWDDISIIILRIIDRKSISKSLLKGRVENILNEEYLKEKEDTISITNIQFKKILMQLECLGLIKSENEIFKATKNGNLKYINWLLIKK
ncbi:MAG: hypothetical protein ACLU4S_12395 [Clostridium perfringens]